jgi:hypothetical protein
MSNSQSGGCPDKTNPYHECTGSCRLKYGLDDAAGNRAQVGAKVAQGQIFFLTEFALLCFALLSVWFVLLVCWFVVLG